VGGGKQPLQIFRELQRRNVFRVTIGYIVSCWLLAQVADLVLDNTDAPVWVMQTLLLVFALGLPVVVFFSWAYEVTPEGIKRESEIDRSQSITHVTARKLDRAIMLTLVLALAYFAFDKFYLAGHRAAEPTLPTAAETAAGAPSIAVLPFVNMSEDASNEYFSEGLSEELLNLLAKNPALRVAARTSSFSFKDQALEISEIAQRLNVAYVLEGSVRRAGDQVRVTAQLIKADDGYHLWSETYDRTLDNIFLIQDEIAGQIASALLPRIIASGEGPGAEPEASSYDYEPPPEVYQRYLLARSLFNRQTREDISQALEILTPLVRENQGYAQAQALYAHVMFYSAARTGGDVPWIIAEAQVRKGIREALALDPDLAEAHLVDGLMYQRGRNLPAAISSYEKTIARNPSYAEAYVNLGDAALTMNDEARAWEALDKARSLDPLSVSVLTAVANAAMRSDRPAIARETLETLDRLQPEVASELRTVAAVRTGELARVAIEIERHRATYPDADFGAVRLAFAYALLGKLEEAGELEPEVGMIVAAQQGREEFALRMMEDIASRRTDPHDRADVYWMAYCALGRYEDALEVLSDLWYGYAEEQMGPRMDGFDVDVFAMLLSYTGRQAEADRVVEIIRANQATRGIRDPDSQMLFAQGRLDDAVKYLAEQADQNKFEDMGIKPYFCYAGLDQHPGYPALVAKFEVWRAEQQKLYESLKAEE
jgi:TolB-like protein/tetratricopeptide (TPR) repeat protein